MNGHFWKRGGRGEEKGRGQRASKGASFLWPWRLASSFSHSALVEFQSSYVKRWARFQAVPRPSLIVIIIKIKIKKDMEEEKSFTRTL